jgi:acetyl-CoA/propionyl-CoA carboxylase, biotin carboxylase, biotin carboxyl carrier protein
MKTLLIANRGEIACRVIRTARAEGWMTVAVHTDVDREALHVREAHQAYRVGSYLDVDEMVRAAQAFVATHVHPGYGFLSERAEFVRALDAAGLVLVGPSAEVMEAMGRKDRARKVALAAGVPVVPSYAVEDDPATFDYPVLVKAAAGGGGKGMRVVRSEAEFDEAIGAARREAAKAFGDDTMLVEKYVEHGRHIEVQVIGDHHGSVRHLFERDCSTQRRHQKVLEEAPAPTLTDEQRAEITRAGVDLAREVGYTNAGTVEFLLDSETGRFYFLEMNTRLQVEHPVTEEVVRVSGRRIDLVALQLRVATGQPLGFDQADVTLEGHAIEARVYAEDPYAGFLPQAGRASIVRWPTDVRVDHALESGQEVGTSYDPMLGKVVAGGADRDAARRRLVDALDRTAILGLTTNTGFLRSLAADRPFAEAAIDTAWLDRSRLPDGIGEEDPLAIAAWTDVAVQRMTAGDPHPFGPDGWRLGGRAAPFVVELDDRVLTVDPATGEVEGVGAFRSTSVQVEPLATPADHVVDVKITSRTGGHRYRAVVNADPHQVELVVRGQRFVFQRPDVFADHGPVAGDGTITAPMPGTVLDVRVDNGQEVAEGDVLGTLEAMKMELALTAPFAGTVAAVDAKAGEQVALGARLFLVEQGLVEQSLADQSPGEPGESGDPS